MKICSFFWMQRLRHHAEEDHIIVVFCVTDFTRWILSKRLVPVCLFFVPILSVSYLSVSWHVLTILQTVKPIISTGPVRSTRELNIYTWECLSVHYQRGVLQPGPRVGGGVYPHPSPLGGTPIWLTGGTPRTELGYPPKSGLDGVPPPPISTGWGYPLPPPPCWQWMVIPPSPYQETEQQTEFLLHGGRYASCFHAGGLSCTEK